MTSITELLVFGLGAGGLLAAGLLVLFARNPLHAALYLIAGLCASALLYVLLDAGFVAAMQVLVYAGAIMVLFVFVIMLLNLGSEAPGRPAYLSVAKLLGAASCIYIGTRVALDVRALQSAPGRAIDGSVAAIGKLLLTDYLFGFEAISVLLLVAVVGAVVLGLKRLN